MRILAHRGASADAPENTLPAFREAAAQGADGVELDVMLCGSGEVVVCHDERLTRVAGLEWEVASTPLWKLRRADVGSRLGFAPAQLPLLEEVMEALPSSFLVNVELKCERAEDRGLSLKVGELLERGGHSERVLISSFNPLCLVRLARAYPRLRRGYLIDLQRSWFLQTGLVLPLLSPFSVHPHHSACTARRVSAWHRLGLKVGAWTVDELPRARELEGLGVDYLFTNRPGELRRGLRSPGRG